MARRSSSGGGIYGLLFILIMAGSVLSPVWEGLKSHIPVVVAAVAGLVLVILLVRSIFSASRRKRHRDWVAYLTEKYNNSEIVSRIVNGEFWKGQTEEQLIDSLGNPTAVDEQVLKTKKKQVWKYGHIHSGQYRIRVTLEHGKVVGWDQKS